MKTSFVCLLLFSLVFLIESAPFMDFNDGFSVPRFPELNLSNFGNSGSKCTNMNCPSTATSCSKKTTTSDDRKIIKTTVECFANGQKIDGSETSYENQNPNSVQNGYEFFGSYSGGNQVINIKDGNVNVKPIGGSITENEVAESFEE